MSIKYILFLISFTLYAGTASQSLSAGDSGELILAACGLGVPHPAGFPLYVLLGKVFCSLPFGTPALRINWMSGFFGALTVVLFFRVLEKLGISRWVGFFSALFFATSPLFWSISRMAEVYTLHCFFIALLLIIGLTYRERIDSRSIHLFFLILGLATANHWPMVALSGPGLLLLVASPLLKKPGHAKACLLFLIGPLLYGLLPLFSSHNPPIDWGHPNEWTNFWIHVLRRTTSETDSGYLFENTYRLIHHFVMTVLVGDVRIIGLPLALWGIYRTWDKRREFLMASLAIWGITNGIVVFWVQVPWSGPWIESVDVIFACTSFFMVVWMALGLEEVLGFQNRSISDEGHSGSVNNPSA